MPTPTGSEWKWCSKCGLLWAPEGLGCTCKMKHLRSFPAELDPAITAAYALGGSDAVHPFEQQQFYVHMYTLWTNGGGS